MLGSLLLQTDKWFWFFSAPFNGTITRNVEVLCCHSQLRGMILAKKIVESRKHIGDFKVGLFTAALLCICGKDVFGYCVGRRDLGGRAELTLLRSFNPKLSQAFSV